MVIMLVPRNSRLPKKPKGTLMLTRSTCRKEEMPLVISAAETKYCSKAGSCSPCKKLGNMYRYMCSSALFSTWS